MDTIADTLPIFGLPQEDQDFQNQDEEAPAKQDLKKLKLFA